MLKLNLVPVEKVRGCYRIKGESTLPPRMRWMHPKAAESFEQVKARVVLSDMFRSPESSLEARKAGRGAEAPGYSGHNFGVSVDVDVDTMIKKEGFKKADLDYLMESAGFFCHRRDSQLAHECWHYNWGIERHLQQKDETTRPALHRLLIALYGSQMKLTLFERQECLKKMGFYGGAIDGKVGPLTRAAMAAFERAWGAADDRTIAYVAAERPR